MCVCVCMCSCSLSVVVYTNPSHSFCPYKCWVPVVVCGLNYFSMKGWWGLRLWQESTNNLSPSTTDDTTPETEHISVGRLVVIQVLRETTPLPSCPPTQGNKEPSGGCVSLLLDLSVINRRSSCSTVLMQYLFCQRFSTGTDFWSTTPVLALIPVMLIFVKNRTEGGVWGYLLPHSILRL